ncbi:phosphoribosyltransferase family protein [Taibaiella chishuiensis]|uniref:Ribose-phosphate pyrophosphokinase n=1 Tax=Taibaiella chishuiensis TaxID=1434707 RepID=A0A2P8DAT5_9BACT|nr:phosphoribosyltransferase family protein [Taibaiella chishuiensis]PSK94323.1 ribose-phosphate pyrophosphokinase [Taibaiella chishuiensis]
MHTLNLVYPEQSDLLFKTMVFPDGQPHIKIDAESAGRLDKKAPLRIMSRIAGPADLLLVLLVKNTLDYLEFEHIELHISYLMAARMDRVMLEGEPFSLKVVAAMLNQGRFKKIKIFDPHSEVTTALVDRSYTVTNHAFVQDAVQHYLSAHTPAAYSLVSPDAGALKKIHKLAQYLGITDVVECMKERDLKTGALTNFQTATTDLGGQTCFLVDDICDGGGTFAGVAALLKEKGAAEVVLIVSHGIFSKGTAIPGVDQIYTTDSYRGVTGVNCFAIDRYLS